MHHSILLFQRTGEHTMYTYLYIFTCHTHMCMFPVQMVQFRVHVYVEDSLRQLHLFIYILGFIYTNIYNDYTNMQL